jgi:hypothetical protein
LDAATHSVRCGAAHARRYPRRVQRGDGAPCHLRGTGLRGGGATRRAACPHPPGVGAKKRIWRIMAMMSVLLALVVLTRMVRGRGP